MDANQETSRSLHLQWCKDRALEYVKTGDLVGAVSSMISDLKKHDGFDGMTIAFLGMAGVMDAQNGDKQAVRRWIEGWS